MTKYCGPENFHVLTPVVVLEILMEEWEGLQEVKFLAHFFTCIEELTHQIL